SFELLLWIGIGSICMFFIAFSSAYVVRKAQGDWVDFALPDIFWATTGIIFLSSLTMHWAFVSAKKDKINNISLGLGLTLFLGIAFSIGQVMGWNILNDSGIKLERNPSGSFVYVISGMHLVHIIGGLVFLLVMLIYSLLRQKEWKGGYINSQKLLAISLCSTYWHFVDGLWIFLFLFFLINRIYI
ncbi:MAG: cytochrome c oxidase subunit 3, partial [Bacteroidetes bacterium]|nr:cytochrome c oxidase subunit 3 [Bacteroidota bacterium]